MNNNHSTEHIDENELRAELEDRLIDQCLDELLGNAPLESALDSADSDDTTDTDTVALPVQEMPRRRRAPLIALACSLLVVVGTIVGLEQMAPQQEDQTVAMLENVDSGLKERELLEALHESDSLVTELVRKKEVEFKTAPSLHDDFSVDFDRKQTLSELSVVESKMRAESEVLREQLSPVTKSSAPMPRIQDSQRFSEAEVLVRSPQGSTRDYAEFRGETPQLHPANPTPNLTYNYFFGITPANGVPLGWRKADVRWDDQKWGIHIWEGKPGRDGIDPLQGVGPGNRGDNYAPIVENDFQVVTDTPLSTFSIDVDTASYSNMRRYLTQNNMLPPPDAVRIEELVNYFNYDYLPPNGDDPFAVRIETGPCAWQPEHRLVQIGLKGKEIPQENRPASNLVFLLDISGSMKKPNKLELLKSCLKMMVDYLTENDSIAIVVYASGTRVALPSPSGDQKAIIMETLDRLQAGGSTNGAGWIQLAYQTATENFIEGGINRVILATDGDFNVGITAEGELQRLIEEKAKSGVFLTTLGFGFGNLQDNRIEMLANKGNGNYAYIDSIVEGRKVLIDEMGSTLNTIAKDVKIQIEFNPLEVAAYRLIGYENRMLAARDFNDDTKDAGEIGAGHTVTALYEIVPATEQPVTPEVDELEFQKPTKPTKAAKNGDMMLVKLRYKQPDEDHSRLLKMAVKDDTRKDGIRTLRESSDDFRFASSVASFGMLLRGSKYSGHATYDGILEIAESSLGDNPNSYRSEFVELVKKAKSLDTRPRNAAPPATEAPATEKTEK